MKKHHIYFADPEPTGSPCSECEEGEILMSNSGPTCSNPQCPSNTK